jgi:colanic acid/amylovoran biosynthesis glycosyltransferase
VPEGSVSGVTGRPSGVAYLTDRYPALSHTFIQREVGALRELGIDVHTFSTHRVGPEHVLSQADREAFATTFAILPISPLRLARAHLRALTAAPCAYLGALGVALRLGRGARARLWQAFYFAEAVVLWLECSRRGLRHVHAHFTRPAADTALLTCELGRRAEPDAGWSWSFSAHGADIYDTDPRALADKVRHATAVVCVSDYGRDLLKTLVEEPHWPRLQVVRCGLDLARYPAIERRPRGPGPVRILTVGRLVPVKGQAVLLRALARMLQDGIDAELTIVGDGPLRASLETEAMELGIARRVRFAGRVGQDDILPFYESADIFALSSFAEGIPVVLMEAMATELPVVASRITAIPELVEDGRNGILVDARRDDQLADALVLLARDPQLRTEMGRAGREQVASRFQLRDAAVGLCEILGRSGVPG